MPDGFAQGQVAAGEFRVEVEMEDRKAMAAAVFAFLPRRFGGQRLRFVSQITQGRLLLLLAERRSQGLNSSHISKPIREGKAAARICAGPSGHHNNVTSNLMTVSELDRWRAAQQLIKHFLRRRGA
jgi:hypothetical protein